MATSEPHEPASSPCQAPPGYWEGDDAPRLSLLVLRTNDLEKTREFYRAIGLDFVAEKHGEGLPHYAAMLGTVVLEIYPRRDDEPVDARTRLGFDVTDLDAVLQRLRTHGIVTPETKTTPCGRQTVVKDPDGRSVELRSR